MFKFLVWHVLLVTVSCELYPNLGYKEYAATYDDYQPHDYNFNYAVSDPHTGDHKSQWEVKENGVVRGAYSLLEPDGTTRIVEYIADDHGFRAVVKKLGTAVHPTPVHVQPEVVPVAVPEISQWKAYDGRVDNYGAVLSQPYIQNNLPIVGPQGQYTFETNLGAAVPQQYFEAPKGLEAYQGGQYTYETDFPAPAPQWAPPPPQWAPKVPELAPGLVPISPTYQTNIVYGLTGNPEDDSRYSKDDYSSEPSQRISKVVPAPPKEKLLIIYPEPESN